MSQKKVRVRSRLLRLTRAPIRAALIDGRESNDVVRVTDRDIPSRHGLVFRLEEMREDMNGASVHLRDRESR